MLYLCKFLFNMVVYTLCHCMCIAKRLITISSNLKIYINFIAEYSCL